jgi:threonine synthase
VQFYSTNYNAPDVTLREALLHGTSPDKGLYMPRSLPRVTSDMLASWRELDYPELPAEVLSATTRMANFRRMFRKPSAPML